MLSYSKCRRRPLSSARKTAPVPHVLHQVTSIGPSGNSSSTDPCCCRSSVWYALATLPVATPMTKSPSWANDAADAGTKTGSCTATYGILRSGAADCAATPAPISATASAASAVRPYISGPRGGAVGPLRHHHEHERSRRRALDRAVRGVQRAGLLEEGLARTDDPHGLVVHGKAQLAIQYVSQHRSTVPVLPPIAHAGIQLEQQHVEGGKRAGQRVTRQLTLTERRRLCLRRACGNGVRRGAVGLFRHHHEHDQSCRRSLNRAERGVQGAGLLEEGLAHADDPRGLVVHAKAHLALEHIPQHRSVVPVLPPLAHGGTQLDQQRVEVGKGSGQSVTRQLAWRRGRGRR